MRNHFLRLFYMLSDVLRVLVKYVISRAFWPRLLDFYKKAACIGQPQNFSYVLTTNSRFCGQNHI